MSPGGRTRLAVALVMGATVGMAAGIGASRVLFVASGVVGCAAVLWAWRCTTPSVRTVVIVAIAARALVLPLQPSLSDDAFRYLWDGHVALSGINPYAHVPSDPRLADLGQEVLLAEMNSPDFYSVYPPAAQVLFVLAAASSGDDWRVGWYVLKGLLVLLELLGIVLLVRLVAPAAALLYAWHPLAIIEVAGQGHLEGGMVGMLVLAIWALARGAPAVAGGALAVAGWFKLWPFVLAPFARPLNLRLILGFTFLLTALALPFAAPYVLPNVRESLSLYVGYFEWNAAPYFLLKEVAWAVGGAPAGERVGAVLQVAFLLSLPFVFLLSRRRGWPVARSWLVVAALFVVTATTVHPWYLLGVLVLLPLAGAASRAAVLQVGAWHVLAAGSLATYLFYTHGEAPYAIAVWSGWGIWALLMASAAAVRLLPWIMRRRARAKWEWVKPHVPAGATILDLGAGDGYVAQAASRDGHEVVLVDVVDFNRTELPTGLMENGRVPLDSEAVDATIIIFVLHHAMDPLALLEEARRVTRGRIVVVESVAETGWDRWWLPRADRFFNRLRSDGAMDLQEEHLHFRSTAEWRWLFHDMGLDVVDEDASGGVLHRRRLFLLEEAS